MKILTVANLVERKRIDLCALACREMQTKRTHPDLNWIVIGRGPNEPELKRLAPESMTFIPKVDNLKEYYREADVFVLPSYDEGFGMVYIESIMSGCPVVCRKGDGGEEIVSTTGGGMAVEIPESNDVAAQNIVSAVEAITSNREKYINESIKEAARLMVDPQSIRQKWRQLLLELTRS